MKSSEPGNPLYRVLALYLPWSVLLSFLPPALALIRRLLPELPLPGAPAVYLPALFISAAVTLYLEFLDPRTSHGGAHLRGAILACAAAYLLSSLLAFRPPFNLSTVTLHFLPSPGSVGAVLAALYIWIFVIYLREFFRARELFESHIRRFRGEDLQRIMLEDSAIMSAAESRGLSAGRHYGVQLGLAFILILLCGFLKAPLSLFQRGLSILIFSAAALIFSLLGLFRQEQFFAGEGIAAAAPERGRRIGAGIILCAAAALLAVLCASDNNLLPISIITAFFAWLARLFRSSRSAAAPVEPPPPILQEGGPQAMLRFLAPEETEPWPFWDYLPYIALSAAIAVFLWFMIKPLFSLDRRSGNAPFLLRLARLFLGGFSGLRRALGNFLASLRGGGGIRIKVSDEKIRDMTEDLLSAWTRTRKRELRRSLSLFARLILWGGREYQAVWKPSMGPGEYCALLAAALIRTSADHEEDQKGEKTAALIFRCGAIFEEALYGPRLPDRETRREFQRLVEEITG
jgi:hypothetical protein